MTSQNECSAKPRTALELLKEHERRQAGPAQPCHGFMPGFTLGESSGKKRLKMLEDSRDNLLLDIRINLDKISCIGAEIKELRKDPEIQSGIMDPVQPVTWRHPE